MTYKDTIKAIQAEVGTSADGIWGPKTMKAVADKLGCREVSVKAIQTVVGSKADGIIGPNTVAAIAAKLLPAAKTAQTGHAAKSVFIDPGHTSDYEREHPSQFTGVDWKNGKPYEIMRILGLDRNGNDSIEHALNCVLSNALNEALRKRGYETMLYDNPNLSNGVEIGQVYSRSNTFKPTVFVSVHNNAQGGAKWKSLGGTASGAVGVYSSKSSKGKALAEAVAKSVNAYRKTSGGPNNRAGCSIPREVAVLTKAAAGITACLIEVGFYDNLDDLYWMCTHVKGIAEAMASSIDDFTTSNI